LSAIRAFALAKTPRPERAEPCGLSSGFSAPALPPCWRMRRCCGAGANRPRRHGICTFAAPECRLLEVTDERS
jgi:hypothetical protein